MQTRALIFSKENRIFVFDGLKSDNSQKKRKQRRALLTFLQTWHVEADFLRVGRHPSRPRRTDHPRARRKPKDPVRQILRSFQKIHLPPAAEEQGEAGNN